MISVVQHVVAQLRLTQRDCRHRHRFFSLHGQRRTRRLRLCAKCTLGRRTSACTSLAAPMLIICVWLAFLFGHTNASHVTTRSASSIFLICRSARSLLYFPTASKHNFLLGLCCSWQACKPFLVMSPASAKVTAPQLINNLRSRRRSPASGWFSLRWKTLLS